MVVAVRVVVAMAVAVRAVAARAAEVARAVAAWETADLKAAAERSVLNLRRPSSPVESVASPAALKVASRVVLREARGRSRRFRPH